MLKRKLFLVLAVLLPSYSYSDSITPYSGQTGNAAALGHVWGMDNVLPSGVPGLDINAVIYNYTIRKNTDDHVDVHVQNENALGSGYIFRETDQWMPGSLDGTQINKVVPVIPGIPRQAWGDGSIAVDGPGSVEDANVIYNYKVDPCYDPQFDPNCPGYQIVIPDIPEIDLASLYDATDDAEITEVDDKASYDSEEEMSDEEKAEQEEKEKEDSKERLEKALAAADNTALFAQAMAMNQMLSTMSLATNMNSYYNTTIPGGAYSESVVLIDKQLPENKRGLRNGLAQQLLHEKMVESQY